MSFQHTNAVKIFKALADNNRLEIMRLLFDGEKCGCVLLDALEIGQPTLSHHMRILCDAGLVRARKKGTWMHYSISKEGASKICEMVNFYVSIPEENYFEKISQNAPEGDLCCEKCGKIKKEN